MKLKIDSSKGTETISAIINKTTDISKKAAITLQRNAQTFSEKSKNEAYQRKLRKYNPVFPEIFHSNEFNIPNVIRIVDDAERKDIDVCQGAIGWLTKGGDVEILCLYDEYTEQCGLKFIPSAVCDAIYCVDTFDRNQFIRTDHIFTKSHQERIAELKHIAYSLGAKKCSIEISETSQEKKTNKKSISLGHSLPYGLKTNEQAVHENSNTGSTQRYGHTVMEFSGSNTPQYPELKWFKYDENIKRLIEMRMERSNAVKSETLELSGTTSATMSQNTAYAIDAAISYMKIKGNSSMESQAIKENNSTLIFQIEF